LNGLRLVVEPSLAEYGVDTEIPVHVLLVNDGNDPVTVNNRFAVSSPSGPGEISFLIIDPSGERLPFGARVNVGRAGPDDVATIPSTGVVATTIDLVDYFDLSEPGTYRVSATYRSLGVAVDGDGGSALPAVWTGSLESDEMSIELR
jgi:hypothetical protein